MVRNNGKSVAVLGDYGREMLSHSIIEERRLSRSALRPSVLVPAYIPLLVLLHRPWSEGLYAISGVYNSAPQTAPRLSFLSQRRCVCKVPRLFSVSSLHHHCRHDASSVPSSASVVVVGCQVHFCGCKEQTAACGDGAGTGSGLQKPTSLRPSKLSSMTSTIKIHVYPI